MHKLSVLLKAHINENEREMLAKKNGKDPAVKGSNLARLLGAANSKDGQDTVLADLKPEDAALLKMMGGSGRVDPQTGRTHFDDGDGTGGVSDGTGPSDGGNTDDAESGNTDNNGKGDNAGSGWSYTATDMDQDMSLSGKGGRSDTAFGKGGELEGFANSLNDIAGNMNMTGQDGHGFGANLNNTWGQKSDGSWGWQSPEEVSSMQNGGAKDAYVDPGVGKTSSAKDTQYQLADLTEDPTDIGFGYQTGYQNPNANLDESKEGAFGLGWQGGLPTGLTYTGLDGQQHANWGNIADSTVNALGSSAFNTAAALSGYGLPGAIISSIANATKGNYGPGGAVIGSQLAGAPGSIIGGALGDWASGKNGSQVATNTASNLANYGLNSTGNGIGQMFANYAGKDNPITSTLANIVGGTIQGNLIGSAANGISDLVNDPNATGSSTMEAAGDVNAGGDSGDAAAADFAETSSGADSVGSSLGGGTGSSETSGYDFIGSKKRSRYRNANRLMDLLDGVQYA